MSAALPVYFPRVFPTSTMISPAAVTSRRQVRYQKSYTTVPIELEDAEGALAAIPC